MRLPPEYRAALERRAAAKGVSVAAVVRSLIERAGLLDAHEPAVQPSLIEQACEHRDVAIIGGGLKRCRKCAATLGLDGTWHPG